MYINQEYNVLAKTLHRKHLSRLLFDRLIEVIQRRDHTAHHYLKIPFTFTLEDGKTVTLAVNSTGCIKSTEDSAENYFLTRHGESSYPEVYWAYYAATEGEDVDTTYLTRFISHYHMDMIKHDPYYAFLAACFDDPFMLLREYKQDELTIAPYTKGINDGLGVQYHLSYKNKMRPKLDRDMTTLEYVSKSEMLLVGDLNVGGLLDTIYPDLLGLKLIPINILEAFTMSDNPIFPLVLIQYGLYLKGVRNIELPVYESE